MPFIAKTAPVSADVGDTLMIAERPMYGGKDIGTGDSVFLWASERQGGRGLWARGIVSHVTPGERISIEVRVDQLATAGHFGLDQIAPYRDSTSETPITGLARKLYKHSHNKIASITNAEANLLLRHFE